jgi:hypothetical protein
MSDDVPTATEAISTPEIQPIQPPPEAAPAKDESAAPKKRATRTKTKSPPVAAPVPEPPPPTPEVAPTPVEKPKPKAKPRAKKQPAAPAVTIDAVDLSMQEEQHEHPPPEEPPQPQRHSEEPIITAATQIDTRTPHQKLMDVQTEMRRLRREAKQVHYKKMLEGKL